MERGSEVYEKKAFKINFCIKFLVKSNLLVLLMAEPGKPGFVDGVKNIYFCRTFYKGGGGDTCP